MSKLESEYYPRVIKKIWGYEVIINNNPLYCGKILHIEEGKSLHLQYHKIKDETLYILSGVINITIGKHKYQMHPGEMVRIKPNTIHKITAVYTTEIIEISTHHSNDDTYHMEKFKGE